MQKKILPLLMIIMIVPFLLMAEWIPLDKNKSTQTAPKITLISEDNSSTVLKIEISGFELNEQNLENKTYQIVDLLSESFTTKSGFPEIPYVAQTLAIPDQAAVSFEVLETGAVQTFDNIYLPPARESWVEGSPETWYIENSDAYKSPRAYPSTYIKMDDPSIFRDFRIARVSVFPMRYFPEQKQLEVASSITVRINYGSGKIINPKTIDKKPIVPSFGKLYRSFIFNYQEVLDNLYGGKEEGHELMLCIMPDDFVANFQIYADWKRLSGTDIHITKFSDIGANANDPSIVKNHIVDAYNNWEVPPTYVLLVGDDGVFPVYTNYNANENYYGEIEGNDYFPEVMVGRFTHQSDYGMQVMINKFLLYEQMPYTADTDWFKKGICCSNDAYASQVETKRFAATRMLDYGNFISVDTMMDSSPCNYSLSDAINAINSGRSFLNYRGEGWSSGWNNYCVEMESSDVSTLVNGQKLTFVTSIGCGVAMFANGGSNCFGEEWVETGTLSNPKGGVAFIGPAGNTHTTYNNKIDKGIYVGMFEEGMDTPGQAMIRGKLYMYNVFGNIPYVESHYKLYCVLGDPSIHIWKDVPEDVNVDYPASVPFGTTTVEFTVTHTSTGQAVSNAQVCVTGDSLFATGYTDELGKAYVDVEAQELETFNVTVRGGNVYPFQGTMLVSPPTGPYVVKDSYNINDVAGGNSNGLMDYGETNLLSITMLNIGVELAENVVVTINSTNPYIIIIDSTADYGSIAAGATAVITDGFAYTVANDIPDLEEVSIAITATNGSESWGSFVLIEAHAPILEYDDYEISDLSGNNNGKLDAGEMVDLIVTLLNTGSSEVLNITGGLLENDPFITINTSQVPFGNINGGSETSAAFSISADSATPAGHLAEFTLALSADLGISTTGEFDIIVGQVPVLIVDLDENSNSAPQMETALNSMDVTYDYMNSFPPDLNLYGTIFLCLGIFPDNHSLSSSEGQTLADYLIAGGALYMEGGDTWAYNSPTAVHTMFNIDGVSDGTSDMGTVVGNTGTFTDGMSFNYTGDNSWMDHIEPISPAFKILDNQSPFYGTGVAYDDGDYKTIGTSHEFGGLQDGQSPSTKEELMAEYLEFLGVTVSLQASFNSNTTELCENETVDFYDLSSGDVISWQWTFEGGYPSNSVEQDPTIFYTTSGSYDVTLTVSDGVENSTITLNDYINVVTIPDMPPTPEGPSAICGSEAISEYTTTGLPEINEYQWLLEPSDAGSVTGNNLSALVFWENDFLGEATLKVAGENNCGTGNHSDPILITRYFPDVTLEPFDWICLDWPAFELTGGLPAGGEFSGPGVEDGWFNPSNAGIGTHTITYTYADANSCENYSEETILVDPCTGINDISNNSGIKIYPNPSSGLITINVDKGIKVSEVVVINALNKVVYSESIKLGSQTKINIDLSDQAKGIYFLKLKTDKKEEIRTVLLK